MLDIKNLKDFHARYLTKVGSVAMIAGVIGMAGFSTSISANDVAGMGPSYEPSAAEVAANDASMAEWNALQERLGYIQDNRDSIIDALVAEWEPVVEDYFIEDADRDAWRTEFSSMLESANAEQLQKIEIASSYDEVRSILGYPVSASVSELGTISPEGIVIPNTNHKKDLVFTPGVPCRFVDTRIDTLPTPSNSTLHLYVMGSGAALSPQGGNSAGCTSPSGSEPGAVAVNMTVVPLSKGHIRVYPYASPLPNASFLNFNTPVNSNLANAGIVQNCVGCSRDISVYVWQKAEVIGDLMGVFDIMPVSQVDSKDYTYATGTNVTNATSCSTFRSVSFYVPRKGWVNVELDAIVIHGHYSYFRTFIETQTASCPLADSATGYSHGYSYLGNLRAANDERVTHNVTRRYYFSSAGTRTFYFRRVGGNSANRIDEHAVRIVFTPDA